MRLQLFRTKNSASFYVVKSVYVNGKRTNKVHEKLGTYNELKAKLGDKDPYEWAEEYVAELNDLEKEGREPVVIDSPAKLIKKDEQRSFNGGYIFLQKIYHKMGINRICSEISDKYKFEYNLTPFSRHCFTAESSFPPQSSSIMNFHLNCLSRRISNFIISTPHLRS